MWLVIVNAIAFIVQQVSYWAFPAASRFAPPPTDMLFALSLGGLMHGCVWQLLTFQFMHAGPWPWHLLLNCWAIFVFGREVEEALGRRVFLTLYLVSGVLGGLLQMVGAWAVPRQFGGEVVGASAGAFGLVAAFATLQPERMLTLLLLYVFPVNLRAKYLLFISGVLAAVGLMAPDLVKLLFMGNVAHAAHLGGMLTGIVCVRLTNASARPSACSTADRCTPGLKKPDPAATLSPP
jgi:membrane associated rhomboid family serine protease